MEIYLVDLALHEIFPIPEELDRNFKEIAGRLAAKMRSGDVTLVDISRTKVLSKDSSDDGQLPVTCNETWFEVILGVDSSVDVITSREPIFNYVIDALEHRDGYIESAFDTQGEGCMRTVVRITLNHLDTSSMDDYNELIDRL